MDVIYTSIYMVFNHTFNSSRVFFNFFYLFIYSETNNLIFVVAPVQQC